MSTVTIPKKEYRDILERQKRLERLFYSFVGPKIAGEDEDIRPEYIRKIQRISKRMRRGNGATAVKTEGELKKFLQGL